MTLLFFFLGIFPVQGEIVSLNTSSEKTSALRVPGQLRLSSFQYYVDEYEPYVEIAVERVLGTDGALRAQLSAFEAAGDAEAGFDFEPEDFIVDFQDGEAGPKVYSVQIYDDDLLEGPETFRVSLSGSSVVSPAEAIVTILDDEALLNRGVLSFSASRYSVVEGEGSVEVVVDRLGGTDGSLTAEVSVVPGGGSATPGDDFEDGPRTVFLDSGDAGPFVLDIPIYDDDEPEDQEDFVIRLSSQDAAILAPPIQATVTIEDNDEPQDVGRLQFTSVQFAAEEDSGFLTLEVVRTGGDSGPLEAVLETIPNGSATPDEDYTEITESFSMQDGETGPLLFDIPIFDDDLVEGPETFEAALVHPDGTPMSGTLSQTLGVILDNDLQARSGTLRLSNHHYAVDEDGGYLEISVERVGGSDGPLEAWLETESISATPGADYQDLSEPVSFQDGETGPITFNVPILDDDLEEGDEEFVIELSEINGQILAQSIAVIYDDEAADNPGEPVFSTAEYFLLESDGPAVVTVSRVDGSEGPLTVNLHTYFIESASPGEDYEEIITPIQFADGEIGPVNVEIPIFDDDREEEPEAFLVVLFDPLDFELEYPYDASAVIILDNDYPQQKGEMVIAFEDYEVFEDEGFVNVVVGRIDGDLGEFRATLVSEGGTATPGVDYQPVSQEIVFKDGEAGIRTVQIVINDDSEAEDPPEYIELELLEDGEDIDEAVVIIHDDDGLNTEILSPDEDELIRVGETVTFKGQVLNGEPDVNYGYRWEICSSRGDCEDLKEGETIEHVFQEEGIYYVLCWGRSDTMKDTTPAFLELSVYDGELVEVSIIKPATEELNVAVGQRVAFEARVTPAGSPVGWFLLSNPNKIYEGQAFSHVFDKEGLFTVVVIAGSEENYDDDYVNINVGGSSRGVRIDSPANNSRFNVGQAIQFVGSQMGPRSKKADLQYAWAMSDGTRVQGQSGRYAFPLPGSYEVDFVGVDSSGNRYKDSITVYIEDPLQSSIVDFNFPTNLRIQPGESVYFKAKTLMNNGYRARDLNFKWDFGNGKTSEQPTPGDITYDTAGVYTATLFAKVRATGLESLRVTRTIEVKAAADSEFEPNETTQQAALLTPGSYSNLSLDEVSAIDVYRFQVTASGQRLVLNLELTDDVIATLTDAQGVELEKRTLSVQGNLQLQGLEPGDYFLSLSPKSPASVKRRAGLSYSIGVSVLNPALYFPEVVENASYATEIGVVNPSANVVSIELVGYTAAGTPTASVQMDLPARGRLHQSLTQLFGAKANTISWVQVDATRDLVGYSKVASRDEREVYGVSANQQLRSEVFVPHIAEKTNQWFTRASVINGTDKASASEIRARNKTAALDPKALLVDKAFSKDSFDFLSRFDGSLPGEALWATFKETGEEPSLAGAEVFGTLDPQNRVIAGLQLTDVRQDNPSYTYIGNNMYFTHIARRTDIFWTGIALVNIGDAPQGVRIKAYGDGGGQIGQDTLRVLEPGEKIVELADQFLTGIGTPESVDWVLVEADQKVVGYELFGTHDFQRIAGLEASTGLRKQLCFPFIDVSKDVGHGVAVINAGAQATPITFTLYDNEGNALGSVVENLNPNQKFSDTIEAIFSGLALNPSQVPGWMEVSANQPLAGFELFTNIVNGQQMGALTAQ